MLVFEASCFYTYNDVAEGNRLNLSFSPKREMQHNQLFVIDDNPDSRDKVQAVQDAVRHFEAMLIHYREFYGQPEDIARRNMQLGCLKVRYFNIPDIDATGRVSGGQRAFPFFEWKADYASLDDYVAEFGRRNKESQSSILQA